MKIGSITVREVFDSRGEPTIEVTGKTQQFYAAVPSGKSRGRNEAKVLNFADAVRSAAKIEKKLCRRDFGSVRKLDSALIRLDGTKNKAKLGGNVMLAVSIAFSRALAAESGKSVCQLLREEFFKGAADAPPLIFSNLINGGVHTSNNLDIQEYMVAVRPGRSVTKSIAELIRFYRKLGAVLSRMHGRKNIPIGDEGGYALNFRNNFEPIAILEKLIGKHRLEHRFMIALDAAATGFCKSGKYRFGGRRYTTEKLAAEYVRYFKKSKLLFSIEDPFAERDIRGFSTLREKLPYAWVVGDDLTTTNPRIIERCAHDEVINAVIIKPNQIGTVSETCEAILVAKKHNLKVVVSHRSGETEDNFIIHLARACGADGVKIGAPVHERIEKFDELIKVFT